MCSSVTWSGNTMRVCVLSPSMVIKVAHPEMQSCPSLVVQWTQQLLVLGSKPPSGKWRMPCLIDITKENWICSCLVGMRVTGSCKPFVESPHWPLYWRAAEYSSSSYKTALSDFNRNVVIGLNFVTLRLHIKEAKNLHLSEAKNLHLSNLLK